MSIPIFIRKLATESTEFAEYRQKDYGRERIDFSRKILIKQQFHIAEQQLADVRGLRQRRRPDVFVRQLRKIRENLFFSHSPGEVFENILDP